MTPSSEDGPAATLAVVNSQVGRASQLFSDGQHGDSERVDECRAVDNCGVTEPLSPLSRTAPTIPHNLIKPLIGLRVAFHGLLMLLFDLLYIFRRSVAFMPNSGKQVSKHLFRARRMVN